MDTRKRIVGGVGGGLILALALLITALLSQPVDVSRAQTPQELLTNTGLENYYGIGGSNVVPLGWTLQTSIPIASAKQQWQFENTQYVGSWHLSTQSQVFTATAFQFVPGIKGGSPLRFSAFANIFTCNKQTSCIEGTSGRRTSDTGSGSKVRVGIDPTGGKDANSPNVVWSAFAQPWDSFQQITVDARSSTDAGVTVFLYATQDFPMLLNNVYWDNVSLTNLGPGGVVVGGATTTPVPVFAAFVTPQATQSDGSIVHTVREGDTLSSIAYAYGVTVTQIRELNGLAPDASVLFPGQKLTIRKGPEPIYVIVTNTPTGDAPILATPTATGSATVRPTFGPVIIKRSPTPAP
jgi:LysM repeat protein